MFFDATEMHVELVEVLKEGAQGGALGHLGKSIDVLGEALAAVAQLAVGAGHVGVGVVDVARKQYARVHLAPVGTHLLAVFAAGVEVGDLVGAKHVVHILGELGLEGGHHGELLTDEDAGEQIVGSGEDHGLFLEVFDVCTLSQEFRHIAHLVAGLFGEPVAGARKNGGADKHRNIRQFLNQLGHQAQILRAVVLGRHMNLQESDVHLAQVIIVTLRGVANEKFALWVVVFQPVFEGSTHEAASDNSDVDHCFVCLIVYLV